MNSTQLTSRFKEVYLDGTWIANTNIKHQLSQVDWKQATQEVAELNTIAKLAFHLNYYLKGLINVFDGGDLKIRDNYSFDCPAISSAEDWEYLVSDILMNAQTFATHLVAFSDDVLNSDFVNPKYGTYRRNIEAVIEHSYYHLGQIVLIRKLF